MPSNISSATGFTTDFDTGVPAFSDTANIVDAFKFYHYGPAYNGSGPVGGIEKHLSDIYTYVDTVTSQPITSVSTITSGTWQGSVIGVQYGGTGISTLPANGELLVGTGSGYTLSLPSALNIALTTGKLSQFASTTSSELLGIISDETGTGSLVFSNSPSLVTPSIGVASATSINKVIITEPATSATLTIANSKALTVSNTLTFTGVDSSTVAFGSGGTVAYATSGLAQFAATSSEQLAGVISNETGFGSLVFANSPTLIAPTLGAATATSINKVSVTPPTTSATLTIADGATLATSGAFSITLTATGNSNITLPTTGTVATVTGVDTQISNFFTTQRSRTTATATTASIANNASWSGTINLGFSYRIISVQTSVPARVRLYDTGTNLIIDDPRPIGTDPIGEHGVMMDMVTSPGNLTYTSNPTIDGYNNESPLSTNIPISVTNLSGASTAIIVTLTYIRSE